MNARHIFNGSYFENFLLNVMRIVITGSDMQLHDHACDGENCSSGTSYDVTVLRLIYILVL
jgi:hypothetical protein